MEPSAKKGTTIKTQSLKETRKKGRKNAVFNVLKDYPILSIYMFVCRKTFGSIFLTNDIDKTMS